MTIMNNSNAFLGRINTETINEENYYLSSASFNCNWYVGFGYIGNSQIHTHLDSVLNETGLNWHDAMLKVFGNSITEKIRGDLWTFCDLFKTFYTLKEAYEVYHSGNSHLTSVKGLSLKSVDMSLTIMKDIFLVVNKISEMMGLNPLEWSKSIENDICFAVNPTLFTRNEYPYPQGKEYTLAYLSPYDTKRLKDYKAECKYLIPKGFKTGKAKNIDDLRFSNLFKSVSA